MAIRYLLPCILFLSCLQNLPLAAQVIINDSSAILDVRSTTRGALLPRMTLAQRDAIPKPATGLIVYCTDNNIFYSNRGTSTSPDWQFVSSPWINNGANIYYTAGKVGIGELNPSHSLTIHTYTEYGGALKLLGPGGYYRYNARLDFGDDGLVTLREDEDDLLLIYAMNGIRIIGGNVGIGTLAPHPVAGLEVHSTTKGFLLPRFSNTGMDDIVSPATGLMVYNTSLASLTTYNGSSWNYTRKREGDECGFSAYGGKSVLIGTQCWRVLSECGGDTIPPSQNQTNNGIYERYYSWQYNGTGWSVPFGGLYQWDEMMDYTPSSFSNPSGVAGHCPGGWHIPSLMEWSILIDYLGGMSTAGRKLKDFRSPWWKNGTVISSNVSGFHARATGRRDVTGVIMDLYSTGSFWTCTESSSTEAWYIRLSADNNQVEVLSGSKSNGFSVRCVKD